MIKYYDNFIKMLDEKFEGHFERVSFYSYLTSVELSLTSREIKEITLASYLHDVGKLAIGDEILNKPTSLSEEEWAWVMKHPLASLIILSPFEVESEITNLILSHHERIDGNGYPRGILGDDIPLGAKIIAVADAYDSMTSYRPYRAPMGIKKAIMELERCSGEQFDPMIVEVFLKLIEKRSDLFLKYHSNFS